MKRSIIITAAIMLLALPLTGCVTSDAPDQTVMPLLTEIANLKNLVASHTTDIAKLKEDVAKKADSSRVDNLATSIGQQSGSQDCCTRAEVTEMINALKSDQSWIKSVSSNGTTSPPATGTVTFVTNPVSIPQIFTSASGTMQQMWTLSVQNNASQWQYVKPIITLNIASGQSSTSVTGITVNMSSGGCNLSGTTTDNLSITSFGDFSVSPAIGTESAATPSLVIMPIFGCNGNGEFQVGAGQKIDILIVIQNMTTSDNTLWNVTTSISSRGI